MDTRLILALAALFIVGALVFGTTAVAACDNQGGCDWNHNNRHSCGGDHKVPVCGDGKVNQPSEQCDGRAGVPRGYSCTEDCKLEKHICGGEPCVDALMDGKLTGQVSDDGQATVTNNGNAPYEISLVSYQMYAELIDDQTYFDSKTKTVRPGKTVSFDIDVPACGYQIDLVCGKPIKNKAPYYGNHVIDFSFEDQDNYCEQTAGSSSRRVSADLTIDPSFPQGDNYVFACTPQGFSATNYNWYFGDGQILFNVTNDNVYHTFSGPGEYHVACTALGGNKWATDAMDITVAE
jgi:plastocyanin